MSSIDEAIAEIAAGRAVVVVDDEDRENEGDLIFAAELATPELMAFLVRHSSGFVCVALPEPECDRLGLPPMHHTNSDGFGTSYRVTVDAAAGVSTGISARDRAHTTRLLADPTARPTDLTRPGHVVPLAARPGGVLERGGHTESAVDLTRLAGLRPAGVLCEIVSTRVAGTMARRDELVEFAATHGLSMISIAELAAYRRRTEQQVERVATIRLPTDAGPFRTVGYRASGDGSEHIALVAGDVDGGEDVPVHLHVECLLGDVFGSRRCGCARRLDVAMREIIAWGSGVVVYLRTGGHSTLAELADRDAGLVGLARGEACRPADSHGLSAHILRDLGVRSVHQLQNPPSIAAAIDDLTPAAGAAPAPSGAVA
jgi:3,4-dihydroxy 2-butanone 4-phosphate synthase/GTP cyclohydrolase II